MVDVDSVDLVNSFNLVETCKNVWGSPYKQQAHKTVIPGCRGGLKGGNSKGGNWDLVDLVD